MVEAVMVNWVYVLILFILGFVTYKENLWICSVLQS